MQRTELLLKELSREVIGTFFDVYNGLGFGFLETVYVRALELEVRDRGFEVAREVAVPVYWKGTLLCTHRLDMVVDGKLIVEVKSTIDLPPSARRQLRSYLRATDFEVGLLLHFGLKPSFQRLISSNGAPDALGANQ